MTRRALGRGLEALIPTRPATLEAPPPIQSEEQARAQYEVDIDRIRPNPWQPRQRFDGDRLQELADSIKAQGVVQPVAEFQRQFTGLPFLVQRDGLPDVVHDDLARVAPGQVGRKLGADGGH